MGDRLCHRQPCRPSCPRACRSPSASRTAYSDRQGSDALPSVLEESDHSLASMRSDEPSTTCHRSIPHRIRSRRVFRSTASMHRHFRFVLFARTFQWQTPFVSSVSDEWPTPFASFASSVSDDRVETSTVTASHLPAHEEQPYLSRARSSVWMLCFTTRTRRF